MKTAEKNGTAAQGIATKANEAANRISNRPSLTGKEAKDETAKDQTPAQSPQTGSAEAATAKAGGPVAMDNQLANPAPGTEGPEVKHDTENSSPKNGEEIKFELQRKPALNLEQTLKSVGDLHRLSVQRLALIARIKTLEDFEVKLAEEHDELESNPYQGCKLIIEDDRRRQFVTNTPNLIRMVSQFIFDACHEKLAEIEANIVFPNA